MKYLVLMPWKMRNKLAAFSLRFVFLVLVVVAGSSEVSYVKCLYADVDL